MAKTGRRSKGDRQLSFCQLPGPVARRVITEAAERGMDQGEFVAALAARYIGAEFHLPDHGHAIDAMVLLRIARVDLTTSRQIGSRLPRPVLDGLRAVSPRGLIAPALRAAILDYYTPEPAPAPWCGTAGHQQELLMAG